MRTAPPPRAEAETLWIHLRHIPPPAKPSPESSESGVNVGDDTVVETNTETLMVSIQFLKGTNKYLFTRFMFPV